MNKWEKTQKVRHKKKNKHTTDILSHITEAKGGERKGTHVSSKGTKNDHDVHLTLI